MKAAMEKGTRDSVPRVVKETGIKDDLRDMYERTALCRT